ncbi:MAG: hypothetical protein ACK4YP_05070, partial [Myxococcota bacterium]
LGAAAFPAARALAWLGGFGALPALTLAYGLALVALAGAPLGPATARAGRAAPILAAAAFSVSAWLPTWWIVGATLIAGLATIRFEPDASPSAARAPRSRHLATAILSFPVLGGALLAWSLARAPLDGVAVIDHFPHEPLRRRAGLVALTWTWCLPTTLVGLAAGLFTVTFLRGRASVFRGATVVRSPRLRRFGGVCLGPVILVTDAADRTLVLHEWGHFRQHLRLGPLYLLLVGIPSATHAVWHAARGGGFPDYFHFWTEAWADELAGIYDLHAHVHPRWTGYLHPWPRRRA